jgi:hypothetical protein
MSVLGLVGLGASLAAIALVAACSSARQREGSQAVWPVGGPSGTVTTSPPAAPAARYVIVNTPTGPIVVPREMAGEIAQQHGGDERDIYEPGAYRGQRHSNDPIGR